MQSQFLQYFATVHLLWVPVALLAWLYHSLALARWRLISPEALLRLMYLLPVVVLTAPLLMMQQAGDRLLTPSLQIWRNDAGLTQVGVGLGAQTPPLHLASTVAGDTVAPMPWLFQLADMVTLLPFVLLAVGLATLLRDTLKLRRLWREAYGLHAFGRVSVGVHDSLSVPISFWLPWQGAVVLLPTNAVAAGADLMMMVRHELQHHRQGDTRPAWAVHLLRWLFLGNPFFVFWHRRLLDAQEFACDAYLIRRKRVASDAYGHCLLQVAAGAAKPLPSTAFGMAMGLSAQKLQRRIHLMSHQTQGRPAWTAVSLFAALLCISLSAYAAGDLVVDRRMSNAEVAKLAAVTNKISVFNIQANQDVVNQLNHFVGLPQNRAFLKRAIARMEQMRDTLVPVLEERGLPEDLLVLPLLESGYQSLNPNAKAPHAAGLWQFIPGTARNFNLRVDDQVDERLDVQRSTEAAVTFLSKLHGTYDDWTLAVLAYNAGPKTVHKGIESLLTEDAWLLVDEGFHGDEGYLARLAALTIIVHHPELID